MKTVFIYSLALASSFCLLSASALAGKKYATIEHIDHKQQRLSAYTPQGVLQVYMFDEKTVFNTEGNNNSSAKRLIPSDTVALSVKRGSNRLQKVVVDTAYSNQNEVVRERGVRVLRNDEFKVSSY